MSDTFLQGLLAPIEAEITAAMAASLEASEDGTFMYSFNSGQTTQSVTKFNLKQLDDHIATLISRRDALRQRLGLASSTYYAGPNY